jgi:hypothetical protein
MCGRWFVLGGNRRIFRHSRMFDCDDPREEAISLYRTTLRVGGDLEVTRNNIAVTPSERADLRCLAAIGAIDRETVKSSLAFRREVLRHFDRLLASEGTDA